MKLDPLTVTVAPTFALGGARLIDAIVTVKLAESELPLASVAITVLAPVVAGGTLNLAVNEPEPSVVTMMGVVDTVFPPNVIPIFELAA